MGVTKKIKKRRKKKSLKRLSISLFLVLILIIAIEIIVVFNDTESDKNVSANPSEKTSEISSSQTATGTGTEAINPPVISTVPTASPVISGDNLSNASYEWYYMPAKKLFADIKSTTDTKMVNLANKYNGIWQDNTAQKVVYITMDTGEDCNSNLNKIMAVAKKENVKITFFLTGSYITRYTEMILKMESEGHIVANHTYNHPNLAQYLDKNGLSSFKKEITDVEEAYKNVTKKNMIKLLRPPEGAYSEEVFSLTNKMGYRLVFWSFAYKDWISEEQPTRDYAVDKILGQLHPGSVILLHPVSKTNTEIFSELIGKMKARGYSFKGLDEF